MSRTHLFIADVQAKPGVPTDHLTWIGKYILDYRPDVIVNIGDFGDMPSLSSYDKGKRKAEGKRYQHDIDAANNALHVLHGPMHRYNMRRAKQKLKQYKPEMHITLGNHEDRINRHTEANPELHGKIGVGDIEYSSHGYNVHDFLKIVNIDGVWYAHYFYNPNTGKPWGGMIETRLKNIGNSFSQGHLQTLMHGIRYVGPKQQHGLVGGAAYLHDEDYKGPQGNSHWRGIVIKHEVEDGHYDPMFVSLDYLCRRYEQMTLVKFMKEKYPEILWLSRY